MAAVNSVVLLGRLTKDPEVRQSSSGTSYCRFTVACDRKKSADDKDSAADFISCVAWRQSAEFLGQYGNKGDYITVNGSIQTGSYTDKDGRKIYTTDVMADRVQLISAEKKQKSDYPHNGRSVRLEDVGKELDAGPEDAEPISNDDLPF